MRQRVSGSGSAAVKRIPLLSLYAHGQRLQLPPKTDTTMSDGKDVKLSVYGEEKDDGADASLLERTSRDAGSLPTATAQDKPAASLTSAEGVKKIWPGAHAREASSHSGILPGAALRICARLGSSRPSLPGRSHMHPSAVHCT